jgi:hypothetical protein
VSFRPGCAGKIFLDLQLRMAPQAGAHMLS